MSEKLIELRPRVVRHITLRRLKKRDQVLIGAAVGAAVLSESQCQRSDGAAEIEDRNTSTVEAHGLLLKEIEEANNWARLVLQLYFAWFGLQFTINGAAIAWLVTRTGQMPWFSKLIFLVFIGWNLLGTIGTVLVYKGLETGDLRMKRVIEAMAKADQSFWLRPQSPMPQGPIKTVFGFCVVTMFISLAFWIVMFVAGR